MRSSLTARELAECISPDEFAANSGLSPETVRRRCRRGQYDRIANVGTAKRPIWRIHPSELGRTVAEVADTTPAA